MTFTNPEFFIFLFVLVGINWAIDNQLVNKITLIAGSCYFYIMLNPWFAVHLLVVSSINFLIGKQILKTKKNQHKKGLLYLGIFINLMNLIFFKYTGFVFENLKIFFDRLNWDTGTLKIILPLGISFYSFRFVSYLIDIYRGHLKSDIKLIDFLLYSFFFPILISGPISRAKNILHQFNEISIKKENIFFGIRLFIIGAFMKVFIADNIAPFVNFYYENSSVFDSITSWLVVFGYSIQIYCDFAGYSSMAIGIALLFGIQIEQNFNFPYMSVNISEFWSRWHITLSNWIRDYLYIPLGGNRKGKIRTYFNIVFSMALCGMWHGASWTFIIWGVFHGLCLVVYHFFKDVGLKHKADTGEFSDIISICFTFFIVSIGWVFFRSENLLQALNIFATLFIWTDGLNWIQPFVLMMILLSFVFHVLARCGFKRILLPESSRLTPFILFSLIWLILVFYPEEFQPFVYGKF